MNFKQTLNQILIKNQDIYKIHTIDDLYNEFLKYGYEFSSDEFYKDFIEFFSFIFKNEIEALSDIGLMKLSGGATNFSKKISASILSLAMIAGTANTLQVGTNSSFNNKYIHQKENSEKSKAQKVLDYTKELASKIMNNSDLKAAFYGLLTIGIPVAVICIILLIRTADSPKKAILNFKTGIENTKENYKNSIIELYVATHNKLLELSKIKNTSEIQSPNISCDETEEGLKQALKEKAQIFTHQKYYKDLLKVIDEIKFEEVEKKEEPKATEHQVQHEIPKNETIKNAENQTIILKADHTDQSALVTYNNISENIEDNIFKDTQFNENEKEWIKFLAGQGDSCAQQRFKNCAEFLKWETSKNSKMESKHDYVQIVFPTAEQSRYSNDDLYFDRLGKDKWTNFFTKNKNIFEKIRYNLNLRLIHMLKFWGFEVNINHKTQKIESLSVDTSKSVVFDNGDHNQKRFTRVLHCLRLFGLNDEYKLLIDIVKKAKQNNKLTNTTYGYYTGTKNTMCLIEDYKLDLTHN